jgi:hypothetical protein
MDDLPQKQFTVRKNRLKGGKALGHESYEDSYESWPKVKVMVNELNDKKIKSSCHGLIFHLGNARFT